MKGCLPPGSTMSGCKFRFLWKKTANADAFERNANGSGLPSQVQPRLGRDAQGRVVWRERLEHKERAALLART